MGVFDGSIGAFVVGTMLSTFLLGVTATQAFIYYQTFPNDRRVYWYIVSFLLVMDWTHTVLSCYTIYDWTVTYYGDVAHLVNSPFSFAVDPAMTGIVASVFQVFYAYRVFVVGKRRVLFPILICLFSLVQLGFSCGATGMIFKLQAFSKFQSWTYGVTTWLACAAAADLLITGSLVYFLTKSNENILQTTSVCNKLIALVTQSNGLNSACAVLFATLSTSYHVTVNLCLIKLYFNSLLVSLNARADLERQLLGPHTSSLSNFATIMPPTGFSSKDIGFPLVVGPSTTPRSAFAGNILVSKICVLSESTTSELMSKDDYEKYSQPPPLNLGSRQSVDMRRKDSDSNGSMESGVSFIM